MFSKAEEKGRREFQKEWGDFPIRFSEDPMSCWDAEMEICGRTCQVEIKHRYQRYDKLMLEEDKAKALDKRQANEDIDHTLYFNSFENSNKTLTWVLDEIPVPEKRTFDCPKTTVKNSDRKQTIAFLLDPKDSL